MQSDDLLVAQLKQGVPAAYITFVERFEASLYRFFFCEHRDHHLAQEQAAETFAQLVRSLPSMRGGAQQLPAYVFATARHVQLRRMRDRQRHYVPLDEAAVINDPGPLPEEAVSEREQVDSVLQAIIQLDETVRNVLLLRFVEDCSIEQIAVALEMPVGTVKSHIHRGRSQLKRLLTKQECKP
jgi:RNA polymerase sigma-70 factor, ECF subfamily